MSVTEIIAELPKLSSTDWQAIQDQIQALQVAQVEESPEFLAAVDEGLRSLQEEGTVPLQDILTEMDERNQSRLRRK